MFLNFWDNGWHRTRLKKKYSWILGLYLFVSFFFVGLVGTGNINEAVKAGMLISFLAIFGGALMRWSREGAEKWLSNQDKEEK